MLLTSFNLAENSLAVEDSAASAAAGSAAGAAAAAAAAAAAHAAARTQAQCSTMPNRCSAVQPVETFSQQAAPDSQHTSGCSTALAAQQQQNLRCCSTSPSGLQHLACMQQLQQLDLSSCGLKEITPLVHLAGELAQRLLCLLAVGSTSSRQQSAWQQKHAFMLLLRQQLACPANTLHDGDGFCFSCCPHLRLAAAGPRNACCCCPTTCACLHNAHFDFVLLLYRACLLVLQPASHS